MRDISVIETPPEGRRPVKTYVGEYDEELVKQAIEREKERGGQAFFVHNRVETIDETAERLRGLCPGVRFEVAHGQMDEKELEQRMLSFLRGEADVLVATQHHRVGHRHPAGQHADRRARRHSSAWPSSTRSAGASGRSRERAYAYLLYPSAAALTEEATKRLSALSDYTELGAGFKIAMRDLEIRGAGNLLGDEQSGHVAALGFELYLPMLDEAVRGDGRHRSATTSPSPCASTSTSTPTCRPTTSPTSRPRSTSTAGSPPRARSPTSRSLRDELEDRFGPVPEPLENLIALQQARIKLGHAGARTVTFRGEHARRHADRARLRPGAGAARTCTRGPLRARPQPGQLPGPARRRSALSQSWWPPRMRCWRSPRRWGT